MRPVLDAASRESRPWLLRRTRLKGTVPAVQLQSIYSALPGASQTPPDPRQCLWAQEELPLVSARSTLGPGPSAHHGGRNREGVTDTQVPPCPPYPVSLQGHAASSLVLPPAQNRSKRGVRKMLGDLVILWALTHVLEVPITSCLSTLCPDRHVTATKTRWASPSRASECLFGDL